MQKHLAMQLFLKYQHWLFNTGRRAKRSAARRIQYTRSRPSESWTADGQHFSNSTELLEDRTLLSSDYGDAPDTDTDSSFANYQTIAAHGGPSHTVVAGLFLGSAVDADSGTLQNAPSDADDQFTAGGSDDEDGVLSPLDLSGTVGTVPTVTLLATNTTGRLATLAGWIDYNRDGVFDNDSEMALVAVPNGADHARFTLAFKSIPIGSEGATYARFRLSTDTTFVESPDSIGAVTDGEVEDYAFSIVHPGAVPFDSGQSVKIASGTNGLPAISNYDFFGGSVATVGDIDGDGIPDLAAGAIFDDTGGTDRGAVRILFLNANGSVKGSTKIASNTNGGPVLSDYSLFGIAVAATGDLDGDGVPDLAVGATGDDTGGSERGAVYLLKLNVNGTVKSSSKIASGSGGGPGLADKDYFGSSVTSLGDIDGDGIGDLAVGAGGDGSYQGAIHVLLLNADGTVRESRKTASLTGGLPALASNDFFGRAVAAVGDLNGDGITDLAVSALGDNTGGTDRGAVYVLMMESDGSAKSITKIASGMSGLPTLTGFDYFGSSLAAVGDINGDGINDLAVGAIGDDTGGSARGAAYLLLLNDDGTVVTSSKTGHNLEGGPALSDGDNFGISMTSPGDLDGDGISELVVGAFGDDTGGSDRGALYVLFLEPHPLVSLEVDKAALEEANESATVTATLSKVSSKNVIIDLGFIGSANTGADYFRSATQITIPAGSTTGSILLSTLQDGVDEADETIEVEVTSVTNGTELGVQQVTTVIVDDDPSPSVTLSLSDSTLAEEGGTAMVTATLSEASALEVTVFLEFSGTATASDDFNTTSTQVVIPAGSTSGSVTLVTVADTIDESDETIIIDISGATNANESGVQQVAALIVDDDFPLIDYGDAPDASPGTSAGNYATVLADNGARHSIVTGLFLGTTVDRDSGTQQNTLANADDVAGTSRDDENGVPDSTDLKGTVGASPTITLIATNTTGSMATLYGWIDYNQDGSFDNATERSSVTVPDNSNGVRFSITFPMIPAGATGTTYARFRLSTDSAAASSIGAASDGEVEDYRFTISNRSDSSVGSSLKIASETNGGPALSDADYFGGAVAAIGDLDGDGIPDLAVGAHRDDTGSGVGGNFGAVHVLLLNADGSVKNTTKIGDEINGGPPLTNADYFGSALAALGDIDGDGIGDLAVAAPGENSVYVLFLTPQGSAKEFTKISSNTNGGPVVSNLDFFGSALGSLGDLDGDGVGDLAVGSAHDDISGAVSGAVYMLLLNTDGSVKASTTIASEINGGPALATYDSFGRSVTVTGDLDGDGIVDLAVGANHDDTGGNLRGAVHILFLNSDGSARAATKIASGVNGGPLLANGDSFGSSVASVGDLDGDGVHDLAIGASYDHLDGYARGAVHLLLLNPDGSAKSSTRISSDTDGGPSLSDADTFGTSVASLGDLNGDDVTDLAVGARLDDTGGSTRGAVHVLFLDQAPPAVSMGIDKTALAEAGDSTTVTASLSYATSQTVTVNLSFTGTAMNVADYSLTDQQIVIPAGSTTGSIILTAEQDTLDEPDETIIIDVASVTNGIELGVEQVSTLITDDDPPPTITLSLSSNSLAEVDGTATVTASLSAVSANTVTVNLTFSGAATNLIDYTRSSEQIVIPAGNSSGSIVLTGLPDSIDEPDETIEVDISTIVNGIESEAQTATVSIVDANFPSVDYGDAPDTEAGTSTRNYSTLQSDNGPSHVIVPGLFLGASVDLDSGTLQNMSADADDVDGALPDDEDGVLSPLDLISTVGTAPAVTLLATNTTGEAATLFGWIDFDQNGVFENSTERASIPVPDSSNGDRFTLTFPAVPVGLTGDTYARFRLSTDAAAASSTGAASDGEVEDYSFRIDHPADQPVTIAHTLKVADGTNGGPALEDGDVFGRTVASVGDLDGDGLADLAVGAISDNTGGTNRGAVHILYLDADGRTKRSMKIAHETNGGPTLSNADLFGCSIASLGDLDGDGIVDLAVGARRDDTVGADRGAVYVLFMKADGSVKAFTKIADSTNGGPSLVNSDFFGSSLAALGDVNGDGITDLAVGAYGDDKGGAVYVLMLNSDGTARSHKRITSGVNGGPVFRTSDWFGRSVSAVGDLDGDGIIDLAVGADRDSTGGAPVSRRGAVHVLFLNSDGSARGSTRIASETNGGPILQPNDFFGKSVATLGDVDGDGINDLAVGAPGDDTGGAARGAMHVLLMNSDGSVKSATRIANETSGGPLLSDGDTFGHGFVAFGDLNGDGVSELAVGAPDDDTGGTDRGAVHILFPLGPQPEDVSLPAGGGEYQVLVDAGDLVIQAAGGAELFRQSAALFSVLQIIGSTGDDVVAVLDTPGTVSTPIQFSGMGGDDRFDASLAGAPATLNGGDGNDTLLGSLQNDTLDGGSGIDWTMITGTSITVTDSSVLRQDLDAMASVEMLVLSADGSDSVIDASRFTIGSVTISGSSGADTLKGGTGDDLILAGSDSDIVSGGAGHDFILGGYGSDILSGDAGNDTILGGRGLDTIEGGENSDVLRGGGGPDTISGGDGNDEIMGEGGPDHINGVSGADTLYGGNGRDNLAGGLGTDRLNGSVYDDSFNQLVRRDTLIGGSRPAARLAAVNADEEPYSETESPQFQRPAVMPEENDEIDGAFSGSLIPQLLEL